MPPSDFNYKDLYNDYSGVLDTWRKKWNTPKPAVTDMGGASNSSIAGIMPPQDTSQPQNMSDMPSSDSGGFWDRFSKAFNDGSMSKGFENPLSQGLLHMGLSMLATPPRKEPYSDLEVLGRGGLEGLGGMRQAQQDITARDTAEMGMYPKLYEMMKENQPLPPALADKTGFKTLGDLKTAGSSVSRLLQPTETAIDTPVGKISPKYAYHYTGQEDKTKNPEQLAERALKEENPDPNYKPKASEITERIKKDKAEKDTTNAWIAKSQEVGPDGKPTKEAIAAQKNLDKLEKLNTQKVNTTVHVHEAAKIREENRTAGKGYQSWTPQEKTESFETWRWTGQKPSFSNRDVNSKSKWEQEKNAYAAQNGGARRFAADQAKFKADTTSYQNVKKASDLTDVAIKQTDNNAEALQKVSDTYSRSNYPGPNKMINWGSQQFGSQQRQAEFAKFKLALMAFSREYMRVVTGAARSVSELTVGAQASADDILSKFSSWSTLKAQVDQAKIEIQNVHKAYGDTLRSQSLDLYGKDPAADSSGGGGLPSGFKKGW